MNKVNDESKKNFKKSNKDVTAKKESNEEHKIVFKNDCGFTNYQIERLKKYGY